MRKVLLPALAFGILSFQIAQADEEELRKEIEYLKQRIQKLEEKLAHYEQMQKQQQEEKKETQQTITEVLEGIQISGGATFIIQSAIDSNNTSKPNEDVTDATYTMDLMLEKELGDYGKAFLHLEAGDGSGLDDDELALFSGVNRDAGDSNNQVEITEAWYEQYLLNKKIAITFGKLDPTCYLDQNEIANDETTQFLSFGFRNNPTIEFPDNSFGIHLLYSPFEFLEAEFSLLDADSDWEDVFDGTFLGLQLNFKPHLFNQEGNYRIYVWRNNSNHTYWLNSTRTKEENYGYGVSIDQNISDWLTGFLRFGYAKPEVSTLEYAYSLGAQIEGSLWSREKDFLGIAFGQNFPSDDYAQAGNYDNTETHLEIYYSLKLNPHLTLSPDLQVIWNPNGASSGSEGKTVKVLGLRAQVDF